LALDRGEWSASCLSCFTPRKTAPSTDRIEGWVDPRFSLTHHLPSYTGV